MINTRILYVSLFLNLSTITCFQLKSMPTTTKPTLHCVSDVKTVKMLFDYNPQLDVNERYNDGRTPVYEATARGLADVVQVLIAHGADVKIPNHEGLTPLHVALNNERADLVEILVMAGATINDAVNLGEIRKASVQPMDGPHLDGRPVQEAQERTPRIIMAGHLLSFMLPRTKRYLDLTSLVK